MPRRSITTYSSFVSAFRSRSYDGVRVDTLHYWLKMVWNSFVPSEFQVPPYAAYNLDDLMQMDPQELQSHVVALIQEILTRPERQCLIDIEINWMMNMKDKLSRPRLETSKKYLRH